MSIGQRNSNESPLYSGGRALGSTSQSYAVIPLITFTLQKTGSLFLYSVVHAVADPTSVLAAAFNVDLRENINGGGTTAMATGGWEQTAGARNAGNKISSAPIFWQHTCTQAEINAGGSFVYDLNITISTTVITPWPIAGRPAWTLHGFFQPT